MVVLRPGSGKKVSFLPKKVRKSQGISFLTTRMNPVNRLPLISRPVSHTVVKGFIRSS